ncbi:hypothetical protein [Novosphingobium marinum]|nr:hypothetical protein [Novosphingobium marinum]
MKNILCASAVALSMSMVPAIASAQSTVPGSVNSVDDKRGDFEMDATQKADYDSWPDERRMDYDTWPSEYQVYYWDLDPNYRTGYWALTPEQRTQIYNMTEAQQQQAWNSVMTQMGAQSANAQAMNSGTMNSTQTATRTAAPSNVNYANNEMVQGNMSATAKQPSEYPICKSDSDDSCINAWAAGKRGPGVDKPLSYWPGKPASSGGQ